MTHDKFTESHIENEMATLGSYGGWRTENGALTKEFRFRTYLEGVRFAVRVAEEAEKMDHHPELTIGWRKVLFRVSTHSVKGLTKLDFDLAQRTEKLGALDDEG
jgi:4a-hydroxytetrahydrobiopterin dehydratase